MAKQPLKLQVFMMVFFCLLIVGVYATFTLQHPLAFDSLTYRYAGHLLAQGKGYLYCDQNNIRFGPYFTFFAFNSFRSPDCYAYGTSPGLPALLAVAEWLGGEWGAQYLIPFLSGVTLIGVWFLGWLLADVYVAWWWLLLVAFQPIWLGVATMPMADIPAIGFAVWAMVFWLKAERESEESWDRWVWALIGGICLGAAFWIRVAAAAWVMAYLLYMLLMHPARRQFFLGILFWGAAGIICLAVVSANFIYFDNLKSPTYSASWFGSNTEYSLRNIFINQLGSSSLVITLLVQIIAHPLGLLCLWYVLRRADKRLRWWVLAVWAGGTFVASTAGWGAWGVDVRFNLPQVLALSLALAVWLVNVNLPKINLSGLRRSAFGIVIVGVMWMYWNPWREFGLIVQRNQYFESVVATVRQVVENTEPQSVFIAGDAAGVITVYSQRSVLSLSMVPTDSLKADILNRMLMVGIPLYWIEDVARPINPEPFRSLHQIDPILTNGFLLTQVSDRPRMYRITIKP